METRKMGSRIALALAMLIAPQAARAADWTLNIAPSGGVNASPSSNSFISINGTFVPAIYFTNGNRVYGYRVDGASPAALGAGSFTTGNIIENFPVAVPLRDGKYYVFVTSQDGWLYKLDATNMALADKVDLRRPTSLSCTPADTMVATPTVQLEAYARADWTYKGTKDVVYVITRHGCSDHTNNQVIALDAANISAYNAGTGAGALWRFNEGDELMDYGAQGCAIDYDRNALYCGTDLSPGRFQPTLWTISTGNTAALGLPSRTAGALIWSANIDAVQTRPQLGKNQLLYVADYVGRLHAYDPSTGVERWNVNVSSTATNVTQNLWAEFRSPYDHLVFVTDTTGVLHVVSDGYDAVSAPSGTGAVVWNRSFTGAKAMTIASFEPNAGKVYVGLDNGTMHQLNLSSRKDESTATIGVAGDVTLDGTFELNADYTNIGKIITIVDGAASGSVIAKEFTVPFAASAVSSLMLCDTKNNPADPNQPDLIDKCQVENDPLGCINGGDANGLNDCCTVGRCVADPNNKPGVTTGYCTPVPRTNGPGSTGSKTQCDDGGGACTTNKICKNGSCVGTWVGPSPTGGCTQSTACDFDPARACGPGKACYCSLFSGTSCKSGWTCVDTGGGGSRLSYSYTPSGGSCAQVGCNDPRDTCNATNGQCSFVWSPCGSLSHSCDDEAPPGVVTHGGNRTCSAGVCSRAANYCAIPAVTDLGRTDQNGIPASQNATSIAFERANPLGQAQQQCTAFMSSYEATTPQSTQISPSPNWSGLANNTGCTLCSGAPTYRLDNVNAPGTVIAAPSMSFPDPEANVAASVTRVTFDVYGRWGGTGFFPTTCFTGPVELLFNGSAIGQASPNGCTILCSTSCPGTKVATFTTTANPLPQCPRLSLGTQCYRYSGGGSNTLTVRTTTSTNRMQLDIDHIDVTVYTQNGRNFIHTVSPSGAVTAYATDPRPGFMNGVALTHATETSLTSAAFTSFLPTATITRGDPGYLVPGSATNAPTVNRVPTATHPTFLQCTGSCPFDIPAFNYFPTAPGSDGYPVSSNGLLAYGNYAAKGDVYTVAFDATGTWVANKLTDNTSAGAEWTSAVAVAPSRNLNTRTDQYVRIAHGTKVDFYYSLKQITRYVLDLASPSPPFGGAAPNTGGVGAYWANAGMRYITQVKSMSVDPLNATSDTYAEVREVRPAAAGPCNGTVDYIVQIRGDDYSVRPLNDYVDVNCNEIRGVLSSLPIDHKQYPPFPTWSNEGRITTDSVSWLHRVVPRDPALSPAAVTIEQLTLPP